MPRAAPVIAMVRPLMLSMGGTLQVSNSGWKGSGAAVTIAHVE
jgi:hypothetical protein